LVLGRGDYPQRVQATSPYSGQMETANQLSVNGFAMAALT